MAKTTKQERGAALYRMGKVEHVEDLAVFEVAGSGGRRYEVHYDSMYLVWECECEDFRRHTRGDQTYGCKHIIAASLLRRDLIEEQRSSEPVALF